MSGDLIVGNDDKGRGRRSRSKRRPMPAARPASITVRSSPIAAACFTRFIITMRAGSRSRVGKIRRGVPAWARRVVGLCPRRCASRRAMLTLQEKMTMPEQTKPVLRPYLAATPDIAAGRQTPRQFLERSLELLDVLGTAHRRFRHHRCPGGARRGGRCDRALAGRAAALADRRHAGRHQGHHRNGRYADANGLAAV